MEQENFTPPQVSQPSPNQEIPKTANKKVYLVLLGVLLLVLIAGGYLVYKKYFSAPSQILENESPISSTPKSEETTKENDFSKSLGISFTLPEGFSSKLNRSYLGLEYVNILYPEKDQAGREVREGVVCFYGDCAVIRNGSTLFPHLAIASNEDVKKIIEDHKKNDQYDQSFIVKEWNKSGIKYW